MKLSKIVILIIIINISILLPVITNIDNNTKILKSDIYNYLVYLPSDYSNSQGKLPLLLHLHGAGYKSRPVTYIINNTISRYIKENPDFPFIYLMPHCTTEEGYWKPEKVYKFITMAEKKYKINTNRIYLTGESMGGHGTWDTAMAFPEKFAAIAPVCGWGETTNVWKIRHLPIRIYHGDQDWSVNVINSIKMTEALEACGAEIKLIIYKGVGHDSWRKAYSDSSLYKWFLKYERSSRDTTSDDSAKFKALFASDHFTQNQFIFRDFTNNNVINDFKYINNSSTEVNLEIYNKKSPTLNITPQKNILKLSNDTVFKVNYTFKKTDLDYYSHIQIIKATGPAIKLSKKQSIHIIQAESLKKTDSKITIDGDFSDWGEFTHKLTTPDEIKFDPKTYLGKDDCNFKFELSYDNDFFYIAVKTIDDKFIIKKDGLPWQQDGIEIRIDARPDPDRSLGIDPHDFWQIIVLALSPADKDNKMVFFNKSELPESTEAVCIKTDLGHNTEAKIPVSYLNKMQNGNWKYIRLNIAIDDYDSETEKGSQIYWKKAWRDKQSKTGSGTFFKN